MQGKLIVFEGVEGCGKTTQIQLTSEWLLMKGVPVIVTREPGGTPTGRHLRRLLLEANNNAIDPRTELLLYAADRAQHVEQELKPNLAAGKYILCDRFIYSTIAYQGHGRGLDMKLINQLNTIATAGLEADLVVWFDIDVETGLARKRRSAYVADRIELELIDFHHRVQQGYTILASMYPEKIVKINANQDINTIQSQIQQVCIQRLPDLPIK
ncbi:thymidylate kinase [Calothrix sp. NIES-4071]|nr:thymidylate kinase [Calothrix sp. NIES-4071]BAZ57436.1 thymidylate kinase [Calothrix sp. NIES-4105]